MRTIVFSCALLCLCSTAAYAQDGRWKSDGSGGCYWDANDSGPNQCDPNATGRWKIGGDGFCYWEGSDSGPNQCLPLQEAIQVHQNLVEIAAETAVTCDEIPEDDQDSKARCNAVWMSISTVVAEFAPPPYQEVLVGYNMYCAGFELLNLFDTVMIDYYGTQTDWTYAPRAVQEKMLLTMLIVLNAAL
jgi:hypothetical protein